jgi:peptidoglycan/LPS O-acetylase OafA/YrhL
LLILGEVIRNEFVYQHPLRHTLLAESYGFCLGILVCDYSVRAQPFQQVARRSYDVCLVLGYIGLAITGLLEFKIEDIGHSDPAFGIAAGISNSLARAACLVLVFLGAARGLAGRTVLGWPWITLIGGACYSIYLVHLPLMHAGGEIIAHIIRPGSLVLSVILCWVILVPACLAGGLIFYACVERPCMRPDWPRDLASAIKAWLSGSPSPAPANSPRQADSVVATPPRS